MKTFFLLWNMPMGRKADGTHKMVESMEDVSFVAGGTIRRSMEDVMTVSRGTKSS